MYLLHSPHYNYPARYISIRKNIYTFKLHWTSTGHLGYKRVTRTIYDEGFV